MGVDKVKRPIDNFKSQVTVLADSEKEVIDVLNKKNIAYVIYDHLDAEGKPGKNITFKLGYRNKENNKNEHCITYFK